MCLEVPGYGAFWTPVSIGLSAPSPPSEGSLLRLPPGFPEGKAAFAAGAEVDFVRKGSLVASSTDMGRRAVKWAPPPGPSAIRKGRSQGDEAVRWSVERRRRWRIRGKRAREGGVRAVSAAL